MENMQLLPEKRPMHEWFPNLCGYDVGHFFQSLRILVFSSVKKDVNDTCFCEVIVRIASLNVRGHLSLLILGTPNTSQSKECRKLSHFILQLYPTEIAVSP